MNLTKNRGWTQVLRKGRQFLLHICHLRQLLFLIDNKLIL